MYDAGLLVEYSNRKMILKELRELAPLQALREAKNKHETQGFFTQFGFSTSAKFISVRNIHYLQHLQ